MIAVVAALAAGGELLAEVSEEYRAAAGTGARVLSNLLDTRLPAVVEGSLRRHRVAYLLAKVARGARR